MGRTACTEPQCLYKSALYRTACTEPQCLYKSALYRTACREPQCLYKSALYRTACREPQCLYKSALYRTACTEPQCLYKSALYRTACTEPQCLYKSALYLTFVLSPGRHCEGPSQLHCSDRFAVTSCPCILVHLPSRGLYSCSEDGSSFLKNYCDDLSHYAEGYLGRHQPYQETFASQRCE
jgi:hypothetical protein